MMRTRTIGPNARTPVSSWSNRFLIAAIAGVLFLTLFPFRFALPNLPGDVPPFLLAGGLKTAGWFDAFLNILLFVPFGFGLAETLREGGRPRTATFFMVLGSGALFSYLIELTQAYIPMRDSGWEDVVTNATGSVVGFLLYELLGPTIVRLLSRCEMALSSWITLRRIAVALSVYFALWFALSAYLQQDTRLSNWDPDCSFFVGNEATGQSAWKGRVLELQIWDQTIPDEQARRLTSGASLGVARAGLLASYDFSGARPYKDAENFLPDLSWTPAAPAQSESSALFLNGKSWVTSGKPVTNLVESLRKSNQFSVHLICVPGETHEGRGHIISISRTPSPSVADLTIRQDESDLVLWFRSPLAMRRSILAWYVPKVFTDGRARDILYSYDGANLSLYIDGGKVARSYRLGPGTALAQILRMVRPSEFDGYTDIYYALVFFPAGIIFGIAARSEMHSRAAGLVILALSFVLAALLLEWLLVAVSGRSILFGHVVLSICILVAGSIWINTDRWAHA
jgi:hypothetical protein